MDYLWRRVDMNPHHCWQWLGYVKPDGYGQVSVKGRTQRVHRVVYELLVGPIPDGLTLDHLCKNRSCVRPDHLEVVTTQENTRRRNQRTPKPYCPSRHRFTPENTFRRKNGSRICLECRRIRDRVRGKYRGPKQDSLDV